jgi:hypothetical protein
MLMAFDTIKRPHMHSELRHFLLRLSGIVALALVPVIVTAFLSLPLSLGRHPGEAPAIDELQLRHMT